MGWGRGTESQPQRGGGRGGGGEADFPPLASDQRPIGRELHPLSASSGSGGAGSRGLSRQQRGCHPRPPLCQPDSLAPTARSAFTGKLHVLAAWKQGTSPPCVLPLHNGGFTSCPQTKGSCHERRPKDFSCPMKRCLLEPRGARGSSLTPLLPLSYCFGCCLHPMIASLSEASLPPVPPPARRPCTGSGTPSLKVQKQRQVSHSKPKYNWSKCISDCKPLPHPGARKGSVFTVPKSLPTHRARQ